MQTTCVMCAQQAHTSMGNMLTAGSEHVATEPASQVNSARGGLWLGLSWPVPLVGRTAATRAVLLSSSSACGVLVFTLVRLLLPQEQHYPVLPMTVVF